MATVTLLLGGVLFGGVTMAIGMLVHEASVLIVIVNAMRLMRYRGTKAVPTPRSSEQRPRPRVAAAPRGSRELDRV